MKNDIFGRMAELYKQRKLVQTLRKMEVEELEKTPEEQGVPGELLIAAAYLGAGGLYVHENELLLRLVDCDSVNNENSTKFYEWKQILNTSINGDIKFVDAIDNPHYKAEVKQGDVFTLERVTSKRLVCVNPDKGSELLSGRYYWLVHVPRSFPEPWKIVFTIGTTLVTAIVTTLITVAIVSDEKNDTNTLQYINEQQEQISTPAEQGN